MREKSYLSNIQKRKKRGNSSMVEAANTLVNEFNCLQMKLNYTYLKRCNSPGTNWKLPRYAWVGQRLDIQEETERRPSTYDQ